MKLAELASVFVEKYKRKHFSQNFIVDISFQGTVLLKSKLTVPQSSILKPRDSILDPRKFQVSSLESWELSLETWESSLK